jgi:hypothetical protein
MIVSRTKFVDVFDLPDVDKNIGTCRNQIPVVLVIDSRTSYGYRNQVKSAAGGGRTNLLDQEYANARAL